MDVSLGAPCAKSSAPEAPMFVVGWAIVMRRAGMMTACNEVEVVWCALTYTTIAIQASQMKAQLEGAMEAGSQLSN